MDPHVRCHLELALRSGKVLVPKLVRIDVCDENENEQYEDAAKKGKKHASPGKRSESRLQFGFATALHNLA